MAIPGAYRRVWAPGFHFAARRAREGIDIVESEKRRDFNPARELTQSAS